MIGLETRSERLRRLGMARPITRRDFIDGVAVMAVAAASSPVFADERPVAAPQDRPGYYYPPGLTGMRGSHPGSFEAAHALRDSPYPKPGLNAIDTEEQYDLIVVGGGISGLAAAHFYRAKAGAEVRILILDNHDDFGGHAKRNEFTLGGKIQLINSGTLDVDSPRPYSAVAASLLTALGIDPTALAKRHAQSGFYPSLGLSSGVFFDKETFGSDRLVKGKFASPEFLEYAPLSEAARRDVRRLETEPIDYLPGLASQPTTAFNFFTLSPTQSSSQSLSIDGHTHYNNCKTGTGCSGTTETTNVTVSLGNITVKNLPGGTQTVSVGDLTGVFTAQYDPNVAALACSIGDGGPPTGQSDCLIWNGETGPLAGKYNGSVEYTYAIGSTNYQLDVFLYNATDWSITPKVAFEVQDAPAVPAPGNTLGLLGIGIIGTAAMGWKRRRQTLTFAS
jgi:hypothetical protein